VIGDIAACPSRIQFPAAVRHDDEVPPKCRQHDEQLGWPSTSLHLYLLKITSNIRNMEVIVVLIGGWHRACSMLGDRRLKEKEMQMTNANDEKESGSWKRQWK
jgi:hypothetical protein